MISATLLNQYSEERSRILADITKLLKTTPGVNAAWLIGSLGRGNGDALSDIDVWISVETDFIHKIMTDPRRYTSKVGIPILFLEAPQNAPEGGVYMMPCYDGPVAHHIVDWYWQPQSLARISGQARLLFASKGVIITKGLINFSGLPVNEEIFKHPIHFISYFWMMLMITAKYTCRNPKADSIQFLPTLIDSINKANLFIGRENVLRLEEMPPHQFPGEKVQLLYQLAGELSELMAIISKNGEDVPTLVTPGAYRYLKMVEIIIEGQGL